MKQQHFVIASIVSILVLIGSVYNVAGSAVMSVDLGSEWMKVSHLSIVAISIQIAQSENVSFVN